MLEINIRVCLKKRKSKEYGKQHTKNISKKDKQKKNV